MIDLNTMTFPLPNVTCVHQLFEIQVAKTPNAFAIFFEDQILTYSDLNTRANKLASLLIALGVKADTLIAIALERSPEMIIALLAILKAGGAYVPLDPNYPLDRLAFMLDDSGTRILITRKALQEQLNLSVEHVLYLDTDHKSISTQPDSNPDRLVAFDTLAYVIYTSGSTGKPKGVAITHHGLSNLAQAQILSFRVTSVSRILQFASFGFDASVSEVMMALCAGSALFLPNYEQHQPGLSLHHYLDEAAITHATLPPTSLAVMPQLPLSHLETLIVAGEPCQPALAAYWSKGRRFFNAYGPTEVTVCATIAECEHDSIDVNLSLPIGSPIANTRLYVLDSHNQPSPAGVPGELHIGGVGLARGYLNLPELTAAKFIPDHFTSEPGARLYKTGDLVRYRSDGNLEFLGRIDHQVKIRGFRIELGEIEAALIAHPAIREAVVIARTEENGEKRLIAYIVEANSSEKQEVALTTAELRSFLKESLPDYMLPAAFVSLTMLPLTPNGKIDRNALPEPDVKISTNAVETHDELEEILVGLFGTLLHKSNPGIHDNFFELGGHSLLAIQLVSNLRDALGIGIPVSFIFESPTVFELAERIRVLRQHEDSSLPVPANRILPDTTLITPDLLPLVTLSQTEIELIVHSVDGGERNIQDIYPLSPLQEGMLFHHYMKSTGDTYLSYSLYTFDTIARCEAFISAFQSVINRHDILRTAIVWKDLLNPVQVVLRKVELPVEICHFDVVDGTISEQLMEYVHQRYHRLDLTQAPLMRIVLAEDGDRWLVLFILHHLIIDQTTLEVIFKEVEVHLKGEAYLLEPSIPFRNFVFKVCRRDATEQHVAFFRNMLGDLESPTIPFGLIDVQGDGSTLQESHRTLSGDLAVRLRTEASRLKVTPAALCHLAWALVLSRCCSQADVVFGTVMFGRLHAEDSLELALGLFLNTLPVRITCDARPVAEALRNTQQSLLALMHHEHASLSLTKQCSAIPANVPLFSSLFNYLYSHEQGDSKDHLEGVKLLNIEERTNYPLNLSINDLGEGFSITALVDATINPERICSFMECALESLVTALEDAPQTPVCALDVLPPSEREQLLSDWNTTKFPLQNDTCVHHLFEEQVSKTPNETAVVFEDTMLTYASLNAKANQLAYTLLALGVKADESVVVALERSPEVVISLLAILKAGGVYVPLDLDYPADRIKFMLEDSGARILITRKTLSIRVPYSAKHTICLDTDHESIAAQPESNLNRQVSVEDLAYVIYTSGSTGKPKGVAVEHRSIALHCHTIKACFELTSKDRVFQFASLSFDPSLEQILPTLSVGAAIVLPPPGLLSVVMLNTSLQKHEVTVLNLPPAFFQLWSLSCEGTLPDMLRLIILGGDVLTPESLKIRSCWQKPWPRLLNAYGPTEATITTSVYDIPEVLSGPLVPIGRPLPHRTLYVLDKEMQPTPIGVPGELHIGGACLARGYLNRPELNAEKFIPDPFSSSPCARLYKTGDLVRYCSDGNVEFLGRIDHQVKIRGFRIELGEIEAALIAHPAIREAVVIANVEENGDKRLVAYIVETKYSEQNEKHLTTTGLRSFLQASLPDYMLPAAFAFLTELPLTPNGKIDRNALPDLKSIDKKNTNYAPAIDLIEKQLVAIWEEVLGVHPIGINDNFFEIGGNSLISIRLLLQIQKRIDSKIILSDIFHALTIRELAFRLNNHEDVHSMSSMVCIQHGTIQSNLPPLFFIHVLGVGMKYCRPIVKYLGLDITVFGLSIELMDNPPEVSSMVEDLAQFYIADVKKTYPVGPYMFIGFSFGGLVAFEMARQLQERGDDIRLVGLIDTIPPTLFKKLDIESRIKEHHEQWKKQGISYLVKKVVTRLNNEWFLNKQKVTHYFLSKRLWYYEITGRNSLMPIGLKEFAGWSANKEAAKFYTPQPYSGKITLFKSDQTTSEIQYVLDPQLGWGDIAMGGVDIVECHGDHVGMLKDPNVEKVSKSLRIAIDKALSSE